MLRDEVAQYEKEQRLANSSRPCLRPMPNDGPVQTEAIGCNGDRSLLETVGMTAERLQHIESRLYQLQDVLYGPRPCEDECGKTPNWQGVMYCALDAFGTSVRIERLVEELIYRTNGDN